MKPFPTVRGSSQNTASHGHSNSAIAQKQANLLRSSNHFFPKHTEGHYPVSSYQKTREPATDSKLAPNIGNMTNLGNISKML